MRRDETTRPGPYKAKQAAEYATYVAVAPIYHDGVLAYDTGYPVPVSNVEKHGYASQGLVRKVEEPPSAGEGTDRPEGRCRLTVVCRGRNRLLAVHGNEMRGRFADDALRLQGDGAVAPRPDLLLAWIGSGRALADFTEPIVADALTPLRVSCPTHKAGHAIEIAALRAELKQADAERKKDPRCDVARVEAPV